MTLVVTAALEELDITKRMSVLNNVVMPRTRELLKCGTVKDSVAAELEDSARVNNRSFSKNGVDRVRNHPNGPRRTDNSSLKTWRR